MASADSVPARMRNVAVWQFLNFLREHSPVGFGMPIQRALDRVRQLVLLAEERDLRQVPAPALHMDAVRLMTVHGSKGLEFEAVHVPGLTQASFPSVLPRTTLPAAGRPHRGRGRTERLRGGQALAHAGGSSACSSSRCRARAPICDSISRAFKPNGNKRSPSELLAKIPRASMQRPTIPRSCRCRRMRRGPRPSKSHTRRTGLLSDRRLELYQKCPRRFFYTHVLGLGGARKSTRFLTHARLPLRSDPLDVRRRGVDGEPGVAEAEAAFETIWQERGPKDHAFAPDYRRLASRLVAALVRSGAGRRFRKAEPLAIDFPNGRVIVEPNEMAELPDGTVVLRRVRTGYRTQDEYDGLEYTLYYLAGAAHFGRGFVVEALHLTDEIMEAVTITTKKLENRRDETDAMLAGIDAGAFPPEINARHLPRCPHFFICPAAPKGPLTLS